MPRMKSRQWDWQEKRWPWKQHALRAKAMVFTVNNMRLRVNFRLDTFAPSKHASWYPPEEKFMWEMHERFVQEVKAGGVTDIHLIDWKKVLDAAKQADPPPDEYPSLTPAELEVERKKAFILLLYRLQWRLADRCVLRECSLEEEHALLRWIDWTPQHFPRGGYNSMTEAIGGVILEILLARRLTH